VLSVLVSHVHRKVRPSPARRASSHATTSAKPVSEGLYDSVVSTPGWALSVLACGSISGPQRIPCYHGGLVETVLIVCINEV